MTPGRKKCLCPQTKAWNIQKTGRFPQKTTGFRQRLWDFILHWRIFLGWDAAALHLSPLLFGDQELTRLGSLKGTDNAAVLHFIHDPRGPGVAQLQTALQHGDGSLSRFQNHFDRCRQQLIAVAAAISGGSGLLLAALLHALLDLGLDFIGVVGCPRGA